MAAPTTIDDLPDDMLHEIFERVISFADTAPEPLVSTSRPPEGAHLALRCVCRRWRDIADWVRLSTSIICVDTSELVDAGNVRARHPTALKRIVLSSSVDGHSNRVARSASSLINGSADLRRALLRLELQPCCLPSVVPAVTPVASCTALTQLTLFWGAHKKERVVPSNMLAPLSALHMLRALVYSQAFSGEALPTSALLAPLPALPDAPRLTVFCMHMTGNFVPVGSDAALGRLRRLEFVHKAPVQELVDAEDPFLLRAAFDAGTWQPSRLTGLQVLDMTFFPVRDDLRAPSRPSPTGSRAGSEWEPLAGQVTQLHILVESRGYKRSSTGIVAGLGVLTALRILTVEAAVNSAPSGWLEPVSIDRMRAPHLTRLEMSGVTTPVSVAQFSNLVVLSLVSVSRYPPLNLRSLVARSSLKALGLMNHGWASLINLAELFVGGAGWPVLERLVLHDEVLEWDATGLDGAPTAVEFAERARQLLPALLRVMIREPHGRNVLPDRSRVEFVVACRRHVVPALLGLDAGGE